MLPEYEEILSNLKVQLKNKVRFTSLKILSARKVADYLPLYVEKGLTNLSSILPKVLFTLVYQEFVETYENILDSNKTMSKEDWLNVMNDDLVTKVFFFATEGLEEFDCRILNVPGDVFKHRTPKFRKAFFRRLATGSPKIKSLKDTQAYISYDKIPNQLLSDHYCLQLMPNLVVLENNFYPVRDADLQVIGLCLPLLQRLLLYGDDGLKEITFEGLKYLTNLKCLKHLTFAVDLCDDEFTQLVKNCLLLMPHVNTQAKSDYSNVVVEFPLYEGPVELGLEHLALRKNTVIPSNVTLPNVTDVSVDNGETTISLLQFKKLRHFHFLSGHDLQKLEQPLFEVGPILQKLSLSYSTCDLMQVFKLCPNLHEVKLFDMKFVGSFDASRLKNCVSRLKKFIKHELEEIEEQESSLDSCGLLHLLLTSCPELEEIRLIGITLEKPEIDLIITAFELGAHTIQKLQKVHIEATVAKEAVIPFSEFTLYLCVENSHILKHVCIEDGFYDYTRMQKVQLAQRVQYFVNKHKYLSYLKNNSKF